MRSTLKRAIPMALALSIASFASSRSDDSITLTKYLQSIKWDATKSGALIAVEPDKIWDTHQSEPDLASFAQKLIRVGNLTAVTPKLSLAWDENDVPNAFDSLRDGDKIAFLVATLRSSDLQKLTTNGICAAELQGEQRAALLSLIPRSFQFIDPSASISNDRPPVKSLTESDYAKVRLQLCKGLKVYYGAFATEGQNLGWSSISSLSVNSYLGMLPNSNAALPPQIVGHIVDSGEKKSQINWNDPRLRRPVILQPGSIEETVQKVTAASELPIYADARIAKLHVWTAGSTATAGDLLRSLTLALGGVVRKVGSVYVLTADLGGTGSTETQLRFLRNLGSFQVRSLPDQWQTRAKETDILDTLNFLPDDPFNAASISESYFQSGNEHDDQGWVSLAELPSSIGDEIHRRRAKDDQRRAHFSSTQTPEQKTPVAGLAGKAKISSDYRYRLLLPDGRPFVSVPIAFGSSQRSPLTPLEPREDLPVDASKLPPGSAVAVASESAQAVTVSCEAIKAHGVREVWIDSQNPSAIKAAIDSGLKIDLIIRPWEIQKGEACIDPDRTIGGQTGTELVKIPGWGEEPESSLVSLPPASFAPADPNLLAHWERLASRIPKQGLNAIVLENWQPLGYETSEQQDYWFLPPDFDPNLRTSFLETFSFGYSNAMRAQFLERYRLDPIDIRERNFPLIEPPIRYFDQEMSDMAFFAGPYRTVKFPYGVSWDDRSLPDKWASFRHDRLIASLDGLLQKIQCPILCEAPGVQAPLQSMRSAIPLEEGQSIESLQIHGLHYIEVHQLGSPNWQLSSLVPTCFDLRQSPTIHLDQIFRKKRP